MWCAFDRDKQRTSTALWRALAESCRPTPDAAVDMEEYEHWIHVTVYYRWGDA